MALVGLARISSGPGQAPCQIRVGNEIAGFGTEFLRDGPFPALTWGYAGLRLAGSRGLGAEPGKGSASRIETTNRTQGGMA